MVRRLRAPARLTSEQDGRTTRKQRKDAGQNSKGRTTQETTCGNLFDAHRGVGY